MMTIRGFEYMWYCGGFEGQHIFSHAKNQNTYARAEI